MSFHWDCPGIWEPEGPWASFLQAGYMLGAGEVDIELFLLEARNGANSVLCQLQA